MKKSNKWYSHVTSYSKIGLYQVEELTNWFDVITSDAEHFLSGSCSSVQPGGVTAAGRSTAAAAVSGSILLPKIAEILNTQ
jgi:hypothetical protein